MPIRKPHLAFSWAILLLTTPMTGCLLDSPDAGGCEPGATRDADDGCNRCQCTDDGQWACTEKACRAPQCGGDAGLACEPILDTCTCVWSCGAEGPDVICDQHCGEIAQEPPACECTDGQCGLVPEPACRPGASRPADDGCNTCECTEEETWACTERACPPLECEAPGGCEAVYDACACSWQCLGPDSPRPICEVDVNCPAIEDEPLRCGCVDGQCGDLGPPECVNGDTLEADNGQSCTCVQGSWECLCAQPAPDGPCICQPDGQWDCGRNQECVPGAERVADDGCNTCTCGADGAWACTEMACPEPMCREGENCVSYFDSCNCAWACGVPPDIDCDVECEAEFAPPPQCACTDAGCTIVEAPECQPGSTLATGNGQVCQCTDAGQWNCLCPAEPPEEQCLCTPDGAWDCRAPSECEPGDAFDADDGQSCLCNDAGTWECLCSMPSPGDGCMCLDGVWACAIGG